MTFEATRPVVATRTPLAAVRSHQSTSCISPTSASSARERATSAAISASMPFWLRNGPPDAQRLDHDEEAETAASAGAAAACGGG
jgi:hypothetical protein